jgi:hypothetical protein
MHRDEWKICILSNMRHNIKSAFYQWKMLDVANCTFVRDITKTDMRVFLCFFSLVFLFLRYLYYFISNFFFTTHRFTPSMATNKSGLTTSSPQLQHQVCMFPHHLSFYFIISKFSSALSMAFKKI